MTMKTDTYTTEIFPQAPPPDRPVTSEYVEELRAFVAEQDRLAHKKRVEAISDRNFVYRLLARVAWMKWQDIVFSVGELVFMFGLIASLVSSDKPAVITSLTTGGMLVTYLAVHRSFKLWVTFTLTLITATMWFILAAQVIFS